MSFEIKIDYEVALKDVNAYLDKKRMLPKRRETLTPAVEAVAEGISLGFIVIANDSTITHTLIDPIKDKVTGENALETLTYKSRLEPSEVNKKISALKVQNQTTQTVAVASLLTEQPVGMLDKLEPQDRNICDCISLFFI